MRKPPDCPACGKESFRKRQHAESQASLRMKSLRDGTVLRVYRCTLCGAWHLTHQGRIRREPA
ncbi:hypothetical protein NBH00_05345 [Paraconexibacter antarcticus]|uniref:Uncharacterized protein n=1 Tax=Paraconexibacter antarcticus TaxID=2949664 RepID=A0ABY5DVG5_9ACTN|nr:hypothetical protein [Paraconexibacter antarcticus]UTI65636.1 hypothetical protein NBH00_05345 [Paraconexibacter antarcticus]